MKIFIKTLLCIVIFSSCSFTKKECKLNDFSSGYTPKEIGDLISNRFVELNQHVLYRGKYINYQEVCLWVGALRYAQLTENVELTNQLIERFQPFFSTEAYLLPPPVHVDLTVFGAIPLELYYITKEQRYYEMGMAYVNAQWELPKEATEEEKTWAENGYSWQTRLWIDDMYMITLLQSQAYKVTGERKYIDRAARKMVLYLDELQRQNGLFYHAPDVPFFWGRGNGWMAVGMTELLAILPDDNQDKTRILQGYQDMMRSLKEFQMSTGLWNQLIDDPECWSESSASAMFRYAMIVGVKSGWLDAVDYAPGVKKGWLALVDYLDENGDLKEVCVGTNKENSREYYYNRKRRIGDYHGQAPMVWSAYAFLKNY